MTPFLFIVVALAVWQIVEITHHSELFASARSHWELSDRFFYRLLRCPFCLSVWVAWFLIISVIFALLMVYYQQIPPVCLDVSLFVVYGFAASRLANVLNDVTHAYCRTPRQIKVYTAEANPDPHELIIAMIIKDNVLYGAEAFYDAQEAEDRFKELSSIHIETWSSYTEAEAEEFLENGYIECNNTSVCLTWPNIHKPKQKETSSE